MGCGPFRGKKKIPRYSSEDSDSYSDSYSGSSSKSRKRSSRGSSRSNKTSARKGSPKTGKPTTPRTSIRTNAGKPGTPKPKAKGGTPKPKAGQTTASKLEINAKDLNSKQGLLLLPKPPNPKYQPNVPPPGIFQLPPTVRPPLFPGGNMAMAHQRLAIQFNGQPPQQQWPPGQLVFLGPSQQGNPQPMSPPPQAMAMQPNQQAQLAVTVQQAQQQQRQGPMQVQMIPVPMDWQQQHHQVNVANNPIQQDQIVEHMEQIRIQQVPPPQPPSAQGEVIYSSFKQEYQRPNTGQAVPQQQPMAQPQAPPNFAAQYNVYLQQFQQQQQKGPLSYAEYCQMMIISGGGKVGGGMAQAPTAPAAPVQPPEPWTPVFGPNQQAPQQAPPPIWKPSPQPPPSSSSSSWDGLSPSTRVKSSYMRQEASQLIEILRQDTAELKKLLKASEAREQIAKLDRCIAQYHQMAEHYQELKRDKQLRTQVEQSKSLSEEYSKLRNSYGHAYSFMSKIESEAGDLVKSARASSHDSSSSASSRLKERLSQLKIQDACNQMQSIMELIKKMRSMSKDNGIGGSSSSSINNSSNSSSKDLRKP